MKNGLIAGFLALGLLAGGAAAEEKAKGKAELVEKTGAIEIIKADAAKNEKYDTILLKAGEETIKLLPGADKKAFKPLEKMAGKTVTVSGEYLTAKPPKYPLPALKVAAAAEAKPAKPAKK